MRKFYILLFATLIFKSAYSQVEYGILQGLSYKHDYQKDIDDLYRQEALNMQARQLYEERIRAAYEESKRKAQACSNQLKETYNSFKKFPTGLKDGWYNVAVTNYY